MSRYYQIIDGKRYDASLIRNAKFRTRGQGDGRISHQDAQDLWQIAMDGGRLTEIEEQTFAYLLANFNWTEKAKDYIQEKLAEKAEELKSYYKIIDGLRYDRKIIETADSLVAGQGDGRISKEDAEELLPLFGDFGDVTIIEERTLKYVSENYKWTNAARDWFFPKVLRISFQSDVEAALRAVMQSEFGFTNFAFDYFRDEALQQMLDFENRVPLQIALRAAINSLLSYDEPQSFKNLLSGYTSEDAKTFLENGARLVLLPGNMESEPSLPSFPSPLRGESIAQNWLFGLELFDLTDDIYWVIVSRDGQSRTYNYIGGPNVENEWPRGSGNDTPFFTIQILSCDQPYPGITTDVQDPNGRFFSTKSDGAGQVKVMGPAGDYSIYASDGWSFQSKTYNWNGTGTDDIKNIVLDC